MKDYLSFMERPVLFLSEVSRPDYPRKGQVKNRTRLAVLRENVLIQDIHSVILVILTIQCILQVTSLNSFLPTHIPTLVAGTNCCVSPAHHIIIHKDAVLIPDPCRGQGSSYQPADHWNDQIPCR